MTDWLGAKEMPVTAMILSASDDLCLIELSLKMEMFYLHCSVG